MGRHGQLKDFIESNLWSRKVHNEYIHEILDSPSSYPCGWAIKRPVYMGLCKCPWCCPRCPCGWAPSPQPSDPSGRRTRRIPPLHSIRWRRGELPLALRDTELHCDTTCPLQLLADQEGAGQARGRISPGGGQQQHLQEGGPGLGAGRDRSHVKLTHNADNKHFLSWLWHRFCEVVSHVP